MLRTPPAVRRVIHSSRQRTTLLGMTTPCTCTCAAHAPAASRSPYIAPAVAFPSPFHSHSFASSHLGANAIHAHPAMSLESPTNALARNGSLARPRAGSSANANAITCTSPHLGSTSVRAVSSSPHSTRDVSPFILKGKKGMGTQTSEDEKKSSRGVGEPSDLSLPKQAISTQSAGVTISHAIPDHIHSKTCGCSTEHTIDGDDQLIEDSGEEYNFLSNLKKGISATNAVTDSLAQGESLPTPNGGSPFASRDSSSPRWNLHALLDHNHRFVMKKEYEPFLTTKIPYKRLVVVSCMDTRLTELLPMALDLKNGDAKIIKVAGAMVAHPFGSVMRSILVAVYALGAEHILVVGHHDCGMTGLDSSKILNQAKQRGIPASTFSTLKAAGLDLDSWLSGFDNVRSSVIHSVETIKNHPLLCFDDAHVKANDAPTKPGETEVAPPSVAKLRIPKITVTGMVICPTSGKLDVVTPVDEEIQQLIHRHEEEQHSLEASEAEKMAGHRDALSA